MDFDLSETQRKRHDALVSEVDVVFGELPPATTLGVFGGASCLRSEGVEHQVRDSAPAALVSGTNELQRELAARDLCL